MTIKVLNNFYDKHSLSRLYKVGEVVDFDPKRAEDIISRGLGEEVKEETPAESTPEVEETPAEEKKKPGRPKSKE